MPAHIEIMTARIEAMTPHAPLTPHIHAVTESEWFRRSRRPIGKQKPIAKASGATNAATTRVRPGSPHPTVD